MYLVPTVHGKWFSEIKDWTVMGDAHQDSHFFSFEPLHYHLDRRFLPHKHTLAFVAERYPLCGPHARDEALLHLGPVIWRRRMCLQEMSPFPVWPNAVKAMQAAISGTQCRVDNAGWICPHRQFSLGSIEPDASGIIRCPLHGLQVNAETGVVI